MTVDDRRLSAIERMGQTASRVVDNAPYPRGCPHRSRVRITVRACSSLPEPQDLQTRFVCLASGRLGLRAGATSHFHAEWLDWDRMLPRIPQHNPASVGTVGGKQHKRRRIMRILHTRKRWTRGDIPRQSPPRDLPQSTSRFGWNCVWYGSPANMIRFRGHAVL